MQNTMQNTMQNKLEIEIEKTKQKEIKLQIEKIKLEQIKYSYYKPEAQSVQQEEVKNTNIVKNEIEAKYIKKGNKIIFNNTEYKVTDVSNIPVKNSLHNKILLTLCNINDQKIIDECFPMEMKIQISQ